MSHEEQRRAWAGALIARGRAHGPLPGYGSAAWHQLAPSDPRRIASVVVAAEAWAVDGDDLPARLRRELADHDHAETLLDDEEFRRVAAEVRALAARPSRVELARRRGRASSAEVAAHERELRSYGLRGGDAA